MAGTGVCCASLEVPKTLMKMGLCMVLIGHVNFLLGALVHGVVLRHINLNKEAWAMEYAVSNVVALTSGLVTWSLFSVSLASALMAAASAIGLSVSAVWAVVHGERSLLAHCHFPDDVGYSSIAKECPFDPTRIYSTTLILWVPLIVTCVTQTVFSSRCSAVCISFLGLPCCPGRKRSRDCGRAINMVRPMDVAPPSLYNDPPSCSNDPPSRYNDPPSRYNDPPSRSNDPPSRSNGPPSLYNDPPSCSNGPPSLYNGPPSLYNDPPSCSDGPPSRSDGPPSRYDGPPSRYDGPPSRYDGPPSRYDGPGPPSRYDGPPSRSNDPPSRYDGPGPPSRYDGPPSRYDGPPSRYSGPPSRYSGPPSRYDGPPQSYTESSTRYTEPSRSYYQPPRQHHRPSLPPQRLLHQHRSLPPSERHRDRPDEERPPEQHKLLERGTHERSSFWI
ncbi:leucine-rich repeat extensin-like protein 3 isoform X2 [Etheostoma cragini]|uniref:leucine-rich repeat extensin-like protein 3 isoform X2 n=1 Tax=Etheostoma cragini TaxID=417921 RepID=UPI00155E15EF|nr:leucine-rich repeat extensin-like protein 3 isoform X2 [Etheostoma cragini]